MSVARGQIVAVTDSDCAPEAGWLDALAKALTRANAAQGATVPFRPSGPTERTVCIDAEDGLYATCNMAYRRSAYDAAGGFDSTGGFPGLIAEVPELRGRLQRGVLLGGSSRLFVLGGLVSTVSGRRRLAVALLAVWITSRAHRLYQRTGSWRTVASALPSDLTVDAVTAAALTIGSIRARELVL